MFVIVCAGTEMGKGWFSGFDREGAPHWISGFCKFCKSYKTESRARKQRERILAYDEKCGFHDDTRYDIETLGEEGNS